MGKEIETGSYNLQTFTRNKRFEEKIKNDK